MSSNIRSLPVVRWVEWSANSNKLKHAARFIELAWPVSVSIKVKNETSVLTSCNLGFPIMPRIVSFGVSPIIPAL